MRAGIRFAAFTLVCVGSAHAAVTHGGKPWLFEIVWVSGGEQPAQAALAAVRTMRIQ
jgi:hypothetical protein